ncbi:MAG TPA: glycoside hydrolase 43 family protein [Acidobacteriaceae bacterium]
MPISLPQPNYVTPVRPRRRRPAAASLITAGVLTWTLVTTRTGIAQNRETPSHYTNPILWDDLADIDILRVGDTYYYSASNMHYSPGAPILRSYDLTHWEYIGHSLPVLDFSPKYSLQGGQAYVKGSWASFLGYRPHEKAFYWGGCIEFRHTPIYSAPAAEGPWKKKAELDKCYYDAGLLVDDDDTMFVAYGGGTLHVAQLSPDGTREVKNEAVFTAPKEIGYLEGSRFYKYRGNYYIFTTHPANAEYVLRSTHGPFGPYEVRPLLDRASIPIPGAGVPHQGGIVQTAAGAWYYMAFIDAFPGGRVPVMAPLQWTEDGWPTLNLADNTWQLSYPAPLIAAKHPSTPSPRTSYRFTGPTLEPEWEWNHNPDNSKWSLSHGLILSTATVTDDLYGARNTLTHRIPGPMSAATVHLDFSRMKDGDCAGLVMLRDLSAWIGVVKEHGAYRLVRMNNLTMDKNHDTLSKGTQVASLPLNGSAIWLRVNADIHPGPGRTALFSYSNDGKAYNNFGDPFVMTDDWHFFMGYRFGIFNYATGSLGGSVSISSFDISQP